MKNYSLLLLVSTLFLLSFTSSELKQYSCDQFSIGYPATWTADDSGSNGTLFYFSMPLESKKDKFQENGNVVIEVLPEEYSLDEYTAAALSQLRGVFPDYKIVSKNKLKVNGVDAVALSYTTKVGKLKLQLLQCYMIKDKKTHVISFGSLEKTFSKHLPTFLQVIGSYQIK